MDESFTYFKSFIMFPATVSQNSMFPTLLPNDQLIIKCTNKFEMTHL